VCPVVLHSVVNRSLIPLYLFSSWFAPNPSSVVSLGSPQNLTGPLYSKPHSSASLVGHSLHQHLPSSTPHQSIVLQFGQDQHTPSLMNQHTPSSLMLTSQLPCTQLLSLPLLSSIPLPHLHRQEATTRLLVPSGRGPAYSGPMR